MEGVLNFKDSKGNNIPIKWKSKFDSRFSYTYDAKKRKMFLRKADGTKIEVPHKLVEVSNEKNIKRKG